MPPTNDTGYELSVGPDVDGKYFSVEPGADYELPAPPRGVSDIEADSAAEAAEQADTDTDPEPPAAAGPTKTTAKKSTGAAPDPAPAAGTPDSDPTAPSTEGSPA